MYFRVLHKSPATAGEDGTQSPHWTIAGTFFAPRLTGDDGHGQSTHRFDEPVLFEIDTTCRVRRVASPEAKKVASRFWFATLKTLEVVLPAGGSSKSWTARQDDANGTYEASYTRGDEPSGQVIVQRQRLGYLNMSATAAVDGVRPRLVSGTGRAEYRPGEPWFHAFHQDEHLELLFGTKPLSDIVMTVDVAARSTRDDLGDFWTRDFPLADVAWMTGPPNAEEPGDEELPYADRAPIAGLNHRALATVMSDFAKLVLKQPADFDDALNLLVQYLRIHPDAALAIIDQMRDRQMEPFVRSVAFLAMQQTGGKPMQRVLNAAMTDPRLEPINRLQAASALKDVPDPDRSVVDALLRAKHARAKDEADADLKNVTTLGLGGLAGSKKLNPADRKLIVDDLTRDLGKSADPADTRAALLALGNSGDKSQVEKVKAFLTNDSELARANAYRALSALDSLPPQGILVDTYVRTPNGILKGVIAQVIMDNKQPVTEAEIDKLIAMLAENPPDADVRGMLIRLLGPFAATIARARLSLVQQYKIETVPELQTLIGRFVTAQNLL